MPWKNCEFFHGIGESLPLPLSDNFDRFRGANRTLDRRDPGSHPVKLRCSQHRPKPCYGSALSRRLSRSSLQCCWIFSASFNHSEATRRWASLSSGRPVTARARAWAQRSRQRRTSSWVDIVFHSSEVNPASIMCGIVLRRAVKRSNVHYRTNNFGDTNRVSKNRTKPYNDVAPKCPE